KRTDGAPTAAAKPPVQGAAAALKKVASKPPQKLSAAQELEILIRARYPVIYVTTWEEERVERCLRDIAKRREKNLFIWTITDGIIKVGSESARKLSGSNTSDPLAALDAVMAQMEPAIYLFKDFHHFTEAQRCNLTVIRRLRDAAHYLRDTY